jgi:hypothetical protein
MYHSSSTTNLDSNCAEVPVTDGEVISKSVVQVSSGGCLRRQHFYINTEQVC